jgi:hypothetical protein
MGPSIIIIVVVVVVCLFVWHPPSFFAHASTMDPDRSMINDGIWNSLL